MIFEDTPNPNAKKINTDHPYALSVYLSNEDIIDESEISFFINNEDIRNIFTGPGFITITKVENVSWEKIIQEFNNYS